MYHFSMKVLKSCGLEFFKIKLQSLVLITISCATYYTYVHIRYKPKKVHVMPSTSLVLAKVENKNTLGIKKCKASQKQHCM